MTLIEALRFLGAGWRTLLVLPALAAAATLLLTREQPRTWRASAAIQLAIASDTGVETTPGARRTDSFSFKNQLGNDTATLQSRAVLTAAAETALTVALAAHAAGEPVRLRGTEIGDPIPWMEAERGSAPTGEAGDEAGFRAWALGRSGPLSFDAVRASLSVKRPNEGDILQLELTANDRALGLLLLDSILAEFAARRAEQREGAASSAVTFFEAQVTAAHARLQSSEDELEVFRRANDISNYQEQTRSLAEQIKDVGFVLEQARAGATAALTKTRGVEALLGGEPGLLDLARALLEEQAVLGVQSATAAASADAAVRGALAGEPTLPPTRSAALDAALDTLYAARLTGIGTQRAELVTRWIDASLEAETRAATVEVLEAYRLSLLEQNRGFATLGSQVSRLERQISTAEEEYLELLHSLNLSRLFAQQAAGAPSLTVLDAVTGATEPDSSKRPLLVAVAGLTTFAALAVLLLLAAWLDRGLYTPAEIEAALDVPVWGAVPTLLSPESRPNDADLASKSPSGLLAVGCV